MLVGWASRLPLQDGRTYALWPSMPRRWASTSHGYHRALLAALSKRP